MPEPMTAIRMRGELLKQVGYSGIRSRARIGFNRLSMI